jgi:hypothetical protein
MSSTTVDAAAPVQPLHNPQQAAQVVVPKAPLGNAASKPAPGMGARALLAKKMSKTAYVGTCFVSA